MALLEDNQDRCIIERFEKTLMQLLQSHADYQKQVIALREENKKLKYLLASSKTESSRPTAETHKIVSCDNSLVHKINKYIKEIDFCLAYFEQT